ncbi:PIR Superfamily Protein [Plasmodium ovale wallikeri]|uniref:PIR Superfamily Protein n=1 Tax=Plasmodium ovale wallikeri TaxID=864142 RepID=A0A1A9AGQ8_PLAOA|nr:PIR Superfamily Protein [Plasmodium ovale wallikeri]SBT55563.1 PIR Superfamily Protein [Plasmodium ovale wallikeri]
MTCNKKTSDEIYKFFDDFDKYEKLVDIPIEKLSIDYINEGCDSFNDESSLNKIQFPDKICKKFKFLHSKLFQVGDTQKDEPDNKNDCSFLIYWLNNELNGNDDNASICVKDFYIKMKDKSNNFFVNDVCGKDVYDLERYDLRNMNVLYNLYRIRSRINMLEQAKASSRGLCSQYVKECYDKYKEAIINCEENCFAFCNALQMFKRKYDAELGLLSGGLGTCKGEEIIFLPDYNDVLEEYQTERNKQLKNTTLTILIPTFGFISTLIFFKFTPFGQFLGKKIRKKNIMNSDYEKENVILSQLSDVENINFDDGEYNVGYYSSSNS